jgi:SsrA-binding protein
MTSEDKAAGIKIICDNRKARHNYSLSERFEAGMVLTGTEVKALRDGKANLADSYAILKSGELWLLNAHIAHYILGNRENHDPLRTRKLLVHKAELQKLWSRLEKEGYTLIPTKLYFKKGKAKVELALAKGKKSHDKRASIKDREVKRQMDQVMKKRR